MTGRLRPAFHGNSTLLHGLDDVLVSRAAAQIAFEAFADLLLVGIGVVFDQIECAHDHAWCAIAALQPMVFAKRDLHGVHVVRGVGDAFNCGHAGAIGLHCEQVAGFDSAPVNVNRAGTALRRITSDVRTGQV